MKTQKFLCIFHTFLTLFQTINALGSGATLSISYENPTVCAIVASGEDHNIQCINDNFYSFVHPKISYDKISGGRNFFCGLSSGGTNLYCWGTNKFLLRRIYNDENLPLREISVGNDQVCGIVNGLNYVYCWRGNKGFVTFRSNFGGFLSISSGVDFSCGIFVNNNDDILASLSSTNVSVSGKVKCWGENLILAYEIETQFKGIEMISLTVGGFHACGFSSSRIMICKGHNSFGQLDFPFDLNESFEFSRLALGLDYSCAIKDSSKSVVCWGGGGKYSSNLTENVKFETLIGGFNFVCGIVSQKFSIICWGPGWYDNKSSLIHHNLPMQKVLPGVCVNSECTQCGVVPGSQSLCFGLGNICNFCYVNSVLKPSLAPQPMLWSPQSPDSLPTTRKKLTKENEWLLVCVLAAICCTSFGLYYWACLSRKKMHYLVQLTVAQVGSGSSRRDDLSSTNSPRSLIVNHRKSSPVGRLRNGPSMKYVNRAEEFTIQELSSATDGFAVQNKIGGGSFGVVYRGTLDDGREVAIKRGESSPNTRKSDDKSSYYSELAFLSRVHHKNLVRLVGYCDEMDEMLLVYEFMGKGALSDHLHRQNNIQGDDCLINSWKMRIKIALDAARGIEYLHSYAVPPIIHRDIKSSNILLDANWTARVSDFGLSLLASKADFRPKMTAGTFGYIDPEYCSMNILTAKSDVYGFGVVLLELLTGKKAIFKDDTKGGTPTNVVDYAVPAISAGGMTRILDTRVEFRTSNELEAVELVAHTTLHCVSLEGKDRPTMKEIVGHLENAINICEDTHETTSPKRALNRIFALQ